MPYNNLPNAVALRWAKLLEPSSRATSRVQGTFYINMPRGVEHWPEALLLHAPRARMRMFYSSEAPKVHWLLAQQLEELLVEDGLEPSALLTGAFGSTVSSANRWTQARILIVTRPGGYPNSLQRHLEAIRPHVSVTDPDQRLFILQKFC